MALASIHSGSLSQFSKFEDSGAAQGTSGKTIGAATEAMMDAAAQANAMPMSIDELVAYLEVRLGRINQSIRERMDDANTNNNLTKKASQLQSTLGKIGPDATPEQLTAAANEIDQMLEASAGSTDISDTQRQQLAGLSQSMKDQAAAPPVKNDGSLQAQAEALAAHAKASAISENAKGMKETLGSIVSSSSHTDQANLANIQSLVSQMGQATNLVSNMIAAFNEGMKSIISNTRS